MIDKNCVMRNIFFNISYYSINIIAVILYISYPESR